MSLLQRIGWRRGVLALAVAALLTLASIEVLSEEPEIALLIGEPWEDMRRRSSATIDPAIPGHFWGRLPKSDARLRFIDPQYGFITPLARYFTVTFNRDESINGVNMSPQIEPLLLDDTLKVVLDLQEQWRNAGWTPIRVKDFPSFADTPQWRAQLRDVNKGGKSYWHAGTQYQVMLVVNRFKDYRHPTEERYLIKLSLATPWTNP
ncbi:hypothetical protein D3C76_954630 [compost metagenome]|jgi:hypothetical protein|uniref:Uncharacterized protein n=1 Tax=Pseudomonas umsongensis TaxID=198618 RepID=A0AAE6ZZ43_9PSED|nr:MULTISPECIES: hypothetical protein [Pseudomonas]KEX93171.1 hypothetical protein HA62_15245 [Pseudomonas putida]EPA99011.1 hypothetical protein PG5_04760 [Pseudomonas sp. G5(2012)]MBT9574561.1 hypothetical protein [Pseudomonas umsongensis]QFG31455.1 hypothetical protein F6476_20840 [Pseudomonas umsongensis]QJC80796.1 hypothetical protein HGP31_21635 [Pseudomonas umsongensis]